MEPTGIEPVTSGLQTHPDVGRQRLEFETAARSERIAVWQAGTYGLDWIERIADEDGEGIALIRDGYPHWFLVRTADLIPQIVERLPQEQPVWSYGEHDSLLPTGSARRRSTRRP